jgi:hypothetical protein
VPHVSSLKRPSSSQHLHAFLHTRTFPFDPIKLKPSRYFLAVSTVGKHRPSERHTRLQAQRHDALRIVEQVKGRKRSPTFHHTSHNIVPYFNEFGGFHYVFLPRLLARLRLFTIHYATGFNFRLTMAGICIFDKLGKYTVVQQLIFGLYQPRILRAMRTRST